MNRAERLERTAMLLTPEQMQKLSKAHVMLFGLGGVGSYAAEAIGRIGVGKMTIVDSDEVAVSNLNRQLPALESTVGMKKTEVVAKRLRDVAPDLEVYPVDAFYLPDSPVEIPADCTLVLDAIDTVSAKIHLAQVCKERDIPLVSCMGMGNRLDPTQIRIGDLFETSGCPLCRVMRHELRARCIRQLRCIYSVEPARKPNTTGEEGKRVPPGSVSFVPSVAGLYMAYEGVKLICNLFGDNE